MESEEDLNKPNVSQLFLKCGESADDWSIQYICYRKPKIGLILEYYQITVCYASWKIIDYLNKFLYAIKLEYCSTLLNLVFSIYIWIS